MAPMDRSMLYFMVLSVFEVTFSVLNLGVFALAS